MKEEDERGGKRSTEPPEPSGRSRDDPRCAESQSDKESQQHETQRKDWKSKRKQFV